MPKEKTDNSTILKRAIASCRVLSILCNIALALIAIWGAIVVILISNSLLASSEQEAFPIGFAVPFVYALYTANFCMLPILLRKIINDIAKEGTPFTLRNSRRLFLLGWVFVLYSLLEAILLAVDTQFLLMVESNSVQVGTLVYDFASHSGTSINLFPLVISGVFFALSYVFKYGVLLQQESDETL